MRNFVPFFAMCKKIASGRGYKLEVIFLKQIPSYVIWVIKVGLGSLDQIS